MSIPSLQTVVRTLITALAVGDYEAVLNRCSASRLTSDALRQVIENYGRTFIEPPPTAYTRLDAVAVRNAIQPTWSVRAQLWSQEEGRSDLTLEVTIIRDDDCWEVHLEDLHVL
jgi:hypothetical protein